MGRKNRRNKNKESRAIHIEVGPKKHKNKYDQTDVLDIARDVLGGTYYCAGRDTSVTSDS